MASTSEAKLRLVKYTELPGHLQFNPYIYGGYRRLMGTKDCLKSLLYLHNESFNIYSHGKALSHLIQIYTFPSSIFCRLFPLLVFPVLPSMGKQSECHGFPVHND